jgi:ribonuclease Z
VAVAIRHRIPSFAFVFRRKDTPGALDAAKARALGVAPGVKYAQLKSGRPVARDDDPSVLVHPEEVLGPSKRGLHMVIFGDTCDDVEAEPFCVGADLLVHEATMEDALQEKAVEYGHSTPSMAATLAAKSVAKRLVLTHVSPRYKPMSLVSNDDGDDDPASKAGEEKVATTAAILLNEAKKTLSELGRGDGVEACQVHVAEDFYELAL